MIQRACISADAGRAFYDGSLTTPEEKEEAKQRFRKALYDDPEGIETYFILDNEKRQRLHEERIEAAAEYVLEKAAKRQKEYTEQEAKKRAKKEREEQEWEVAGKMRKIELEEESLDKTEWEKEQEDHRAEAERNGIEFVPRYSRRFATKEEYEESLTY
jgi:hypothetical protein